MDKIDKQIISMLQENAVLPVGEIAKKVNLSLSSCWNRIKKLEEEKIIKKRVTILDGKKINLPIVVFVTISVSRHDQKFIDLFTNYNEVIEIWRLSGEFDYLLKVVSESLEKYDTFIKKLLNEIKFISSFHSNIVLQEIKYTTSYPLDSLDNTK